MVEEKIIVEGVMKLSESDISFYTESHDVPVTCVGGLRLLGDGYVSDGWNPKKDEGHIRWKLKEGRRYMVTIEEVIDDG